MEKNESTAVNWFEKSANNGCNEAKAILGKCYIEGTGVVADTTKATPLLLDAANNNDVLAQFYLANVYLYYTPKKNAKKAVYWLKKAATKGNVDAQYNLAICYENGVGTKKDYTQAAKWYNKAVAQGHTDAKYNLAICFLEGTGVEKNFDTAEELLIDAANEGSTDAKNLLDILYQEEDDGVSEEETIVEEEI